MNGDQLKNILSNLSDDKAEQINQREIRFTTTKSFRNKIKKSVFQKVGIANNRIYLQLVKQVSVFAVCLLVCVGIIVPISLHYKNAITPPLDLSKAGSTQSDTAVNNSESEAVSSISIPGTIIRGKIALPNIDPNVMIYYPNGEVQLSDELTKAIADSNNANGIFAVFMKYSYSGESHYISTNMTDYEKYIENLKTSISTNLRYLQLLEDGKADIQKGVDLFGNAIDIKKTTELFLELNAEYYDVVKYFISYWQENAVNEMKNAKLYMKLLQEVKDCYDGISFNLKKTKPIKDQFNALYEESEAEISAILDRLKAQYHDVYKNKDVDLENELIKLGFNKTEKITVNLTDYGGAGFTREYDALYLTAVQIQEIIDEEKCGLFGYHLDLIPEEGTTVQTIFPD